MPIPQDFIHSLLERADLADLIGAHVKLQKKGANWVGLCPFHGEKTPSFTVQPAKGFYHCFGCGAHGDALVFLQKQYGMDFPSAVEKLAAMQGVSVPQQAGQREAPGKRQAVSDLLAAAMHYFQQQLRQSEAAKAYLKSRGMSGDTAKHYKIGYAPDEWDGIKQALASQSEQLMDAGLVRKKEEKTYDYFRNRIIFPIIDGSGRVCGFGGRALGEDDQPKYLNSAEGSHFSKRRLLFGLPQAAKPAQQKKRLIICEGYMDVVMLAQGGFAESVATMGTAATAEQMKKAARLVPNIYLAYDGDTAGQKGAFRAMQGVLPALRDGISVFFLFLPEGHDPDSFIRDNGSEAFEQLLAAAKPLGDYLVEALQQQTEAASEEGQKTGIVKEGGQLLQLVSQQDAPAWRDLLKKKLEEQTGISLSAVQTVQRAPAPAPRALPKSNLRLPPHGLPYNLLCCLCSKPALAEQIPPSGLPLFGGEQEVDVVNGVLEKLRWHMYDDEEGDIWGAEAEGVEDAESEEGKESEEGAKNTEGVKSEEGAEDKKTAPAAAVGVGVGVDVPNLLEKEGYVQLAQQLRDSMKSQFSHTKDIEAQFRHIVARLHAKHNRIARPGKESWLKKLQASAPPSAPAQPPEEEG